MLVSPTPEELVSTTATALVDLLAARIADQRQAHLCLTGGTIAAQLYRHLGATALDAVDWSRVHLWWGDERWVPAGHADRNDGQAQAALGPIWDRTIRHPMPASDSGHELDAAASAYAAELGDTRFDLCLLGVGPDAHVASLFPDHPGLEAPGRVIGVRNSPKPPPERISLTHAVINESAQVWFVVSGADKAEAVTSARTVGSTLPAARVRGRSATVWRVDASAAVSG